MQAEASCTKLMCSWESYLAAIDPKELDRQLKAQQAIEADGNLRDQDGIGKTEFLYARRDLGKLFARVPTGVPVERAQFR
jgi:hypothetical protein